MIIVKERELRQKLYLDNKLIAVMRSAFAALEDPETLMPPILQVLLPQFGSQTCVKAAYLPSARCVAIKIVSSVFQADHKGQSGMVLLLDAYSMELRAMFRDNGYLTKLRTAAAGGLVADLLAPAEVGTVALFGTGSHALLQLEALQLVRSPKRVNIWGRSEAAAEQAAAICRNSLGIDARVVLDPGQAMQDAQVAIMATRATMPIIDAAALHPGLHITAMGSDAPGKVELAPDVLVAADRYVCDSVDQCRQFGELAYALASGASEAAIGPESLAALCAGGVPGRIEQASITIADLTGTGVQDAAIAAHAFEMVMNG